MKDINNKSENLPTIPEEPNRCLISRPEITSDGNEIYSLYLGRGVRSLIKEIEGNIYKTDLARSLELFKSIKPTTDKKEFLNIVAKINNLKIMERSMVDPVKEKLDQILKEASDDDVEEFFAVNLLAGNFLYKANRPLDAKNYFHDIVSNRDKAFTKDDDLNEFSVKNQVIFHGALKMMSEIVKKTRPVPALNLNVLGQAPSSSPHPNNDFIKLRVEGLQL